MKVAMQSLCLWAFHLSELFLSTTVVYLGYRSNNVIVGLTNTDPANQAPVLWNYTLCGQYPGTVPDGATVSVQCTNAYSSGLRFRYVIVQFPLINDTMNFCEIEVFTVGRLLIWRCYQIVSYQYLMLHDVHTKLRKTILQVVYIASYFPQICSFL